LTHVCLDADQPVRVSADLYEGFVCKDDGWATGWEVITSVRRFQHRMEVFIDQSLEPMGITFAQYRALEAIFLNEEIHVSELARLLRLSRQAVQATVQKLHAGNLVDLIHESGRVYAAPSAVSRRRLRRFRRSTDDFKVGIESALSGGERYRLTKFLDRDDRVLETPRRPEWWLAP
jgi:DNA-binding MarR family transcriptional regulator